MITKDSQTNNNWFIFIIALVLVVGLLALSFHDKDSRSAYADLAKLVLGGCICALFPRSR